MQVKDRVHEALEGHRGTYFSGEALAKELQGQPERRLEGYPSASGPGVSHPRSLQPGVLSGPGQRHALPQSIAPFLTDSRPAGGGPARGHLHESGFTPASGGGAHEGLALVAVTQTAARGRRDHSFFSPPDSGLYLSFLLRPISPPGMPLFDHLRRRLGGPGH